MDDLLAPTSEFCLFSVGVDKRTITDGTLLRNVQVTGIDEVQFDKGGTQDAPMTMRVSISWDYQMNGVASVAYLLGAAGVKVNGVGLVGTFAAKNADWAAGGLETPRMTGAQMDELKNAAVALQAAVDNPLFTSEQKDVARARYADKYAEINHISLGGLRLNVNNISTDRSLYGYY